MGIQRVGGIERALQRVFVPLFVATGAVVAAGFFFPGAIGDIIPGHWWLTVALLFFGAGLGYLAVLPTDLEEEGELASVEYLMRIRRMGVREGLRRLLRRNDPVTFGIPVVALAAFVLLSVVAEPSLVAGVQWIQDRVTTQFGAVFVAVMLLSVIFCLALVFSAWGEIKLGGEGAEPSYSYPVYFTLFFSAGIAAGIVFSGMSGPITHYGTPPPLFGDAPQSAAAMESALTYSLYHWGFTAWSAYVVLGLPIAYFVHERGAPLRVSAILTPFLGADGLSSPWGKAVDILAIFATIGGIATSVALVSQQFLTGVEYQWGVTAELAGPILFVGGLTLVFVLSAQSGVHRGIRRISGLTIVLFAAFLVLMLAVGPRGEILSLSTASTRGYLVHFIPMSLETGGEWVANWTVWNWAWWFSWAPFAGLFLAALSRGRRIRTVVLTGVGATGLATMVWFLIMGSVALHFEHAGIAAILGAIDTHPGGTSIAAFPVLGVLPLGEVLTFLFLALIVVFIASSADTSTLVVAILASREDQAPSTAMIVLWGVIQGVVAIVVLAAGSEGVIQASAVLVGGPFAILAVLAMAGFVLELRDRDDEHRSPLRRLWEAIPEQPELDHEDP